MLSAQPPVAEPAASDNREVIGIDDAREVAAENAAAAGAGPGAGDNEVEVDEAIQQAQAAFEIPEGYKMFEADKRNSSDMYKLGVRVELDEPVVKRGDARLGRWYCMANANCRNRKVFVKVKSSNTNSAAQHLKALHGKTSKRRQAIIQKKRGWIQPKHRKLYKEDRERFVQTLYVKSHHILGMEPLNFLENGERRYTVLVAGSKEERFPVEKLNGQEVKNTIVDMYSATKASFVEELAEHARQAAIPFLHLTVDIWSEKKSSSEMDNRYIGLRGFYMSMDCDTRTRLLAVKQYCPGEDVSDERAGQCVRLWAGHVLEEYGLDWKHVLGVVTDKSSGIKFAFGNTPGFYREWCIPRLLNRATIDGFGLSVAPATSKNPPARAVIQDMKKDIEHINTLDKDKTCFVELLEELCKTVPQGRLVQADAHRWVTAALSMECYLVYHPNLIDIFAQEEDDKKLAVKDRQKLLELYSLMKEVAWVIESCQSTSIPSAPPAMLHVVALLKTLDPTTPLLLHDPARFFARPSHNEGGQVPNGDNKKAPCVNREPSELTAVARDTRGKLRAAIFKRFCKRRYGGKFREESHMLDMALAFNPAMRRHGYIDQLAETPAVARAVKAKIWEQITELTEKAVVAKRAKAAATAAAAEATEAAAAATVATAVVDQEGNTDEQERKPCDNGHKRRRMGPEEDTAVMSSLFEDAGIFDQPVVEPAGGDRERWEKSAYEEAKEVVIAWREAKIPSDYQRITQGGALAAFWRSFGKNHHPTLAVVARAVLGAPGSAAVLEEREFGEAGMLASRQSESLDPSFLMEMVMYLRGAYDYIPTDVPVLTEAERAEAVPARLTDPGKMQEVRDLTSGLRVVGGNSILDNLLVGGDVSDDGEEEEVVGSGQAGPDVVMSDAL